MEEKLYTIPLSKAKAAPKIRRASSAIRVIKDYLSRYLETEDDTIHMDPSISKAIWSRGNKKIPSKLRVRIVKLEEGTVEASMPGVMTRSEIEKELEKKKKEKEEKEKEKEGKGDIKEEFVKNKEDVEKQEEKEAGEADALLNQGGKENTLNSTAEVEKHDNDKTDTVKDDSIAKSQTQSATSSEPVDEKKDHQPSKKKTNENNTKKEKEGKK